jgi:hypothetical protein
MLTEGVKACLHGLPMFIFRAFWPPVMPSNRVLFRIVSEQVRSWGL